MRPTASTPHRLALVIALSALLLSEAIATTQIDGRQRALRILDAYEVSGSVGSADDVRILESFLVDITPQWLAGTSASVLRREKVALIVLEMATRRFRPPVGLQSGHALLLEFACEFLRAHPSTAFERFWLQASLALLPTAAHAEHARKRYPSDPAFRLADIMSRAETRVAPRQHGADPAKLTRHVNHGQLSAVPGRASRPAETLLRLRTEAAEPLIRTDALIQLGSLQFLVGRLDESIDTLHQAAESAQGDYQRNMAMLFEGLALDARRRPDDALMAFKGAVLAMPSAKASAVALATRLVLKGDREEAETTLTRALTNGGDIVDPWSYPVASFGRLPELTAQLRHLVGFDTVNTDRFDAVSHGAPPGQQQPAAADQSPLAPRALVFAARTTTVGVDVSVTARGRDVPDLSMADFQVFDNGVRQTITSLTRESLPLDVSIVLDLADPVYTVKGVAGYPPDQSLSDVSGMVGLLASEDRVRLITATTEVREVVSMRPPTATMSLERLGDIPIAHVTSAINDAVAIAIIRHTSPDRRHVVVVFSDGIDGASVTGESMLPRLASQTDVILFYVRRDPLAQFEPPALRSRMAARQASQLLWPARADALEEAAQVTGGTVYRQAPRSSVLSAFGDILLNLRQRYIVWYTPTNLEAAGWHATTVQLQRKGDYAVAARKGYVAR